MWTVGRPRSACNVCKRQKVQCSGDRPLCKRCSRLRRTCTYKDTPLSPPIPVSSTATTEITRSSSTRENGYAIILDSTQDSEELYLGISKSLMYSLVDLYFETAYNASLLLHKETFLSSLAEGAATPHVVLSICAWAANFYHDHNRVRTLKDSGDMVQWANRAGTLVFQDIQNFDVDNIVTFSILSLFWHAQGSWRLCYLYKGNALLCLHTGTFGTCPKRALNATELERQRRRFWACYLMQCSLGESLVLFEPVVDVAELPLPWSEADFAAGVLHSSESFLESDWSGDSIFAELVKIQTLWASVFSYIKTAHVGIREALRSIYALDDDLSKWWSRLHPNFKLDPSEHFVQPKDRLSIVLLINLIYHQSLCALHASIVPLFCWNAADESCISARRSSAQIAFDHACIASNKLKAVRQYHPTLSPAHSFIAYTAYSGCAIQIPFTWCSNVSVRQRTSANVLSNIEVIRSMAPYWKFAALLEIHVGWLYKIHRRHATKSIVEDEPRNMDVTKLLNFKVNAPQARKSILGYVDILRAKREGYVRQGEEITDLGIKENEADNPPRSVRLASNADDRSTNVIDQDSMASAPSAPSQYQQASRDDSLHGDLESHEVLGQTNNDRALPAGQPYSVGVNTHSGSISGPQGSGELEVAQYCLDVVHPFFDLSMPDVLYEGDLPDFNQFEPLPMSFYELELASQ